MLTEQICSGNGCNVHLLPNEAVQGYCLICRPDLVRDKPAIQQLASEIGKIASAHYHTEEEKDEVLKSCVLVSNQIYEIAKRLR